MKSRILLAAVAFLGYAIIDGKAANAATRYYHSNADAWATARAWDDADCAGSGSDGVPAGGDSIVICAGKTVTMTVAHSAPTLHIEQNSVFITAAKVVTVTGSGGLDIDPAATEQDAPGLLRVSASGGEVKLSGGGSHPIDGEIRVEVGNARLHIITSDATLSSSASPSGLVNGQNDAAEIKIDNVTLTSAIEMHGRMRFVDGASAGSFINQGKVIANAANGTLDYQITGTIDDTSGSGRWQVTASGAFLRFLEEPAAMEGSFTVSNGMLQAGDDVAPGDDIDVVTAGDLSHTGGKIKALVGDSFTFNE